MVEKPIRSQARTPLESLGLTIAPQNNDSLLVHTSVSYQPGHNQTTSMSHARCWCDTGYVPGKLIEWVTNIE